MDDDQCQGISAAAESGRIAFQAMHRVELPNGSNAIIQLKVVLECAGLASADRVGGSHVVEAVCLF